MFNCTYRRFVPTDSGEEAKPFSPVTRKEKENIWSYATRVRADLPAKRPAAVIDFDILLKETPPSHAVQVYKWVNEVKHWGKKRKGLDDTPLNARWETHTQGLDQVASLIELLLG